MNICFVVNKIILPVLAVIQDAVLFSSVQPDCCGHIFTVRQPFAIGIELMLKASILVFLFTIVFSVYMHSKLQFVDDVFLLYCQ